MSGVDVNLQTAMIAFHIASVVESTLSDSGIDHKSCWFGGGLVGIVHTVPTQQGLAVSCEFHPETIRSERTDGVVGMVHPADIAEQSLVDTTGKEETEVRILCHPHVGEVLVRHGLKNGTRHFRPAALGVVTIPEFASLPTAVFPLDIRRNGRQQFIGEVA